MTNASPVAPLKLEVEQTSPFLFRHLGPRPQEIDSMLSALGSSSLEELMHSVIPSNLLEEKELSFLPALKEEECLAELQELASANSVWRSFLGLGYQAALTPGVILRNVLENPGWYTQYTPYQAEISQGRLEALLNFQTMVSDLTGLPTANASLLDEGTAAAEAMTMALRSAKSRAAKPTILLDAHLHPQTIAVVCGRAEPLGIDVKVCNIDALKRYDDNAFAAMVAYPGTDGEVFDWSQAAASARASGLSFIMVADLLSLVALKAPASLGADICVGSTQRFGLPMGFGGPHAAFLAASDSYKRNLPGRIVGLSTDRLGKPALRLALQTREQHIRRDKATSNICTAQVLPAVVASMYAVYHGPQGLTDIITSIALKAKSLAVAAVASGHKLVYQSYLDTISIDLKNDSAYQELLEGAKAQRFLLRTYAFDALSRRVTIALDERTTWAEVNSLAKLLGAGVDSQVGVADSTAVPEGLKRDLPFLTHKNFHSYRSEHEMLRYLKRLENRDLSLTHSMIPLGSCTMKLNATTEMIPITWPGFCDLHPAAPAEHYHGYQKLLSELEKMLAELTGFHAISLQPNAGSQGEYTGLLAIRAYHRQRGDTKRTKVLIPVSAHGTNPASAVLAGFETVAINCDQEGNIDVAHLKSMACKYESELAALMITYPSTHGVFEDTLLEVIEIVHQHGGQVYLDGANFNAMLGWCRPGRLGADVCHLNLHKTFCIPHGGGGPGMGPIGVAAHLAPFLPGHPLATTGGVSAIPPVASAPWGSASILPIVWAYLRMMGASGLRKATAVAVLNANYIANQLEGSYPILYKGKNARVAHECILDLRPLKLKCGVEVEDVAKRLIDYSFHAPTMSWPVAGTLMVEPTESEAKVELDRFISAMKTIAQECEDISSGTLDKLNNPLKNAPHTAMEVTDDVWNHPYSRRLAAYPVEGLKSWKFWPEVARVDNAKGDRNLICSCNDWLS